jgi:hypothetical protein
MAITISTPYIFNYSDIGAVSIQNVNSADEAISYTEALGNPKCRTDSKLYNTAHDHVLWVFEEPIINFNWKLIVVYGKEPDYPILSTGLSNSTIIYDINKLYIKITLDFLANGADFEITMLEDYQIHTFKTRAMNYFDDPNDESAMQAGAVHSNLPSSGSINTYRLRSDYSRRYDVINKGQNVSLVGSTAQAKGLINITNNTQIVFGTK